MGKGPKNAPYVRVSNSITMERGGRMLVLRKGKRQEGREKGKKKKTGPRYVCDGRRYLVLLSYLEKGGKKKRGGKEEKEGK